MNEVLVYIGVFLTVMLLSCASRKIPVDEPSYLSKREVEERVELQFALPDTTHFANIIVVDGVIYAQDDSIPVFEYSIYQLLENSEHFYWESDWGYLILVSNKRAQGKRSPSLSR